MYMYMLCMWMYMVRANVIVQLVKNVCTSVYQVTLSTAHAYATGKRKASSLQDQWSQNQQTLMLF